MATQMTVLRKERKGGREGIGVIHFGRSDDWHLQERRDATVLSMNALPLPTLGGATAPFDVVVRRALPFDGLRLRLVTSLLAAAAADTDTDRVS